MTLEKFFARAVRAPNGCLEWRGNISAGGYGRVCSGHSTWAQAHRVCWELIFGQIPPDKVVCHDCDNPKCVDPGHLFVGTPADNNDDKETKGRGNHPARAANGRAKLTEAQVELIRTSPLPAAVLARELGVGKSTALHVRNNDTWRQLDAH